MILMRHTNIEDQEQKKARVTPALQPKLTEMMLLTEVLSNMRVLNL